MLACQKIFNEITLRQIFHKVQFHLIVLHKADL